VTVELRRSKKTAGKSAGYVRAPKQERTLAARLGGDRVKGSGAGDTKGDVRVRGILRVEAKTTSAQSFRVTRQMVNDISDAGAGAGELPVIVIEFLGGDGKPAIEIAVMPTWALDDLVRGE
jgi:hypothetical protein